MLIIPARGNFYAWRQGLFTAPVTITVRTVLWGVPTPIPTPFGGRLASFTPTSGYPSVDFYQNGCIARAVHNGVHAFDHRPF
jgi:hypothetical protein